VVRIGEKARQFDSWGKNTVEGEKPGRRPGEPISALG